VYYKFFIVIRPGAGAAGLKGSEDEDSREEIEMRKNVEWGD
jgi:hypothetical protein